MTARSSPESPTYGPLFSTAKDAALIDASLQRIIERARTDPKQLEKLTKALQRPQRFATVLGEALTKAATKSAPRIFARLRSDGVAMLRDQRAMFSAFETRLYETWKEPLDLLEMMIVASAEAGESVSAQWPWKQSREQDAVFDVVRRLQARACQVAREVLALLKSGYAPAAHARWRTLHETAVTTHFIRKYGHRAAETFLAHEYIEARKAARDYQRYCRRLGYPRYTPNELASFRQKHHTRVKKYGDAFKGDYGWAAVTLGVKRVTFRDIEERAGFDHLRPYYRMASYPVHATVKSIHFSLALEDGKDLLLTGPSNLGLTEPGHGAALSLAQAGIAMLTLHPTSDTIAVAEVLLLFTDAIGKAFLKARRNLMRTRAGTGATTN